MLEEGEINGIIVWHADRLSRNAMDSALLIDLIDKGKLVEIVTPAQTFKNTPLDKFMFMFQCSQAKMENDKKGVDVQIAVDIVRGAIKNEYDMQLTKSQMDVTIDDAKQLINKIKEQACLKCSALDAVAKYFFKSNSTCS
jgi:DNA invertase Pin-like site-specific DNA recombinase